MPFLGILSGPANLLRNLVTKDPGFMLANMMRDSLSAYATSGANMTPLIDTIRNFGTVMANRSPEFVKLVNAGVSRPFGMEWTQGSYLSNLYHYRGVALRKSNTAVNAIRLFPSGGTITGTFKLYGIRA
jgi:hypothetical protein